MAATVTARQWTRPPPPCSTIVANTITCPAAIIMNTPYYHRQQSSMTPNDENERTAALITLQQRIQACHLCQDHGYISLAHPLVKGQPDARVMVIGQAPGHRSVENGRSFSGPGGRILQKWLEQAGFPLDYLHAHAYLSSLTACDPGPNPKVDGDRRP